LQLVLQIAWRNSILSQLLIIRLNRNRWPRYHYAIKPVAHVQPGQLFILETRDALDSDLTFDSKPQDVAAVNLNLVHPLTGPVYIEGAKRGDAIAVTVVDIAPDDFGYTTIVPGFGFLRDVFKDPYIVHWQLNRLEAVSKDLPGIAVPMNAFMGTVGVLPGKPEIEKWLKREKALADAGRRADAATGRCAAGGSLRHQRLYERRVRTHRSAPRERRQPGH